MTAIRNGFARRLRSAREKRWDTATNFADAIGIQPNTYRRWERAETEPSLDDLTTLCRALNITPNELIRGRS